MGWGHGCRICRIQNKHILCLWAETRVAASCWLALLQPPEHLEVSESGCEVL